MPRWQDVDLSVECWWKSTLSVEMLVASLMLVEKCLGSLS